MQHLEPQLMEVGKTTCLCGTTNYQASIWTFTHRSLNQDFAPLPPFLPFSLPILSRSLSVVVDFKYFLIEEFLTNCLLEVLNRSIWHLA